MKKLKFWQYFWNTLKESKWLLLRYFVVGVYLFVVGIIANRLNLQDLTYYNAMITMGFFGEMIAFGFIEGFGIYINQYIKEPEKSRKYAKLGFRFTVIFVLGVAIILAYFPNFILTKIFNLHFEADVTFYYLMIVVMVLMTTFGYITSLMKKTGTFKWQLIAATIESVLVPLGMILILLCENLLLVLIAIIYISVYLVCIVFGHFALIRNKNYAVNVFSADKLGLTKQELGVVFARALSEVVWEVGYVFVSLFILKNNVVTYNQYCYFENALDIINGMFFAFMSVLSIKVARCIGEEKKEDARMFARYGILSILVIWCVYAIISMSIFIPLRAGMNPELRATALTAIVLYLIISLLRFSEWNIGTYILGQSEYFAKGGLILECIFAGYWVVLFLVAEYLPSNIFLVYALIALENIVKIIVQAFVYRGDKWLQKSE